jgi:hypothetical protein
MPPPTRKRKLIDSAGYDPAALLDGLVQKLGCKNDSGLAGLLKLSKADLSRIRHKQAPVTANVLVRMYDASGLTIHKLREMMGVETDSLGQ